MKSYFVFTQSLCPFEMAHLTQDHFLLFSLFFHLGQVSKTALVYFDKVIHKFNEKQNKLVKRKHNS